MPVPSPFWFSGPLSILGERGKRQLLDRGRRVLGEARVNVLPLWFDVRDNGDDALIRLTKRFDGVDLKRILVEDWERRKVGASTDSGVKSALEFAAERIRRYHDLQLHEAVETKLGGVALGWKPVPLDRVGIYVPGGQASYPSTLLMAAIPAKLAGVSELIVCTPPRRDGSVSPELLAAAEIAGVDEVYRVGGAQAIFAMASGTKSIPAVQKIVGPGNVYVQAAKQLVSEFVGIDTLAGPSEVVVIAAEGADPALAAWELAAQAEHDANAAVVLLAVGESMRRDVEKALLEIVPTLGRSPIVLQALAQNGALLSVDSEDAAVDLANDYAPEHLVLLTPDPRATLAKIRAAASVFLGPNSPVALGDYCAGTNHILPTARAARFSSGVSVLNFLRFIQWQEASQKGLATVGPIAERLARVEGLTAHAEAVRVRLNRDVSKAKTGASRQP